MSGRFPSLSRRICARCTRRAPWLASLLLLLALPLAARAQEADILTGRVVDESGKPVVGARVTAMSVETEITRSVLTDDGGRYMIDFPDGGGRYVLRVSFLGKADVVVPVVREGDEELLLANVAMAPEAITLDSLRVTARRPPPGRGDAGEQTTVLPQELLEQLPLPDLDPSTLAQLAAGVVSTELDSLSGAMGFSVAGMSDLLNQVTLDGMVIGESGLEVPQEGIRRTQVTTSTFDASRGGFAGGQVAMTSARGNNRTAGSLSYSLDDDALQLGSPTTVNAFTRQNIGGSIGGPIVHDKLFYNLSFGLRRNVNHRFALAADDPVAALRAGVAVDSVDRFLATLGGYGVPISTAGAYDQLRDNLSLQFRTDWSIVQRRGQAHTLSLRLNSSTNDQDSTRINALDLAQHGGDTDANTRAGSLTLDSRLGRNWTNALAASFSEGWNDALPYLAIPEGRVRVTSELEDGHAATQTLVFGGNRNMPTDAYRKNLQLSDDLSFLLPVGSQLHRLKVGGILQRSRSIDRSTDDLLGSFEFNSTADFEANRPARYERTLAERDTRMSVFSGGLYVGDTWRVSEPLELTAGLRWDYSRLSQKAAYNPAVEQAFGRRTDVNPVASSFSPRLGFDYRIASGGGVRSGRIVSGGIGVFSGQAPTSLFARASRQTGLSDAERQLICIGDATPIPDWSLYLSDPASVPDRCADGSTGVEDVLSSRAPTVTLIDPDQRMPASLRAEIGYRAPLPLGMSASVRYSFSRGLGLWGFYDVNLDRSNHFALGTEGRPFFGEPGDIVPSTGATSLAGSRIHPAFGNVWDIRADRASVAHQITAQVGGQLPKGITLSANYTLGFARDQGSGGFTPAPTAGDPDVVEWAASDNDRRHTLNLTLAKAITSTFQITALARLSSGRPFTPLVGADVNGDGALDDRAFLFDPAATADTAVANGMRRLLREVPGRVASCIESQLGRIAARNSCRSGWSRSLSLRASLRPNLPGLERRLTLSVDASNVLEGLDQLVHGADDLHGWGDTPRPDPRLLDVRAFDPATRSFVYQVNEGFGQNRVGPSSIRSPFALRINARVAIGGIPFLSNRGFGTPRIAGDFGGGGRGGRGDGFSGRGGFGGGAGGRRAGFDAVALLDRMLANPLPVLLALKDTLGMTPEQVTKIEALSTRLGDTLTARRQELGRRFDNVSGADQGRVFTEIRPALESTRREIADALDAARKVLTPEQWKKVPEQVRDPFRRGARGRPARTGSQE